MAISVATRCNVVSELRRHFCLREENMKKTLKTAAAALLALGLTACGSSAPASSAAAGTGESKEVIIAMSPDYPPFDDLTADGQITGFDYDMAEWVFSWLNENGYNYTHTWKQMSFDTIISAIQADQVDLGISGFTYDAERKVLFSEPYYESAQVAVVGANSDIASKEDLKGKSLVAQLGATGETVANGIKEEDDSTQVTAMQDMGIAMETLASGGCDAVILDIAIARHYANENPDKYKMIDEVLLDENVHIIAKEGNTELMDAINQALKAFLESDEYESLKAKYGI